MLYDRMVTVRLLEKLVGMLDEYGLWLNASRGEVIRMAIIDYLNSQSAYRFSDEDREYLWRLMDNA